MCLFRRFGINLLWHASIMAHMGLTVFGVFTGTGIYSPDPVSFAARRKKKSSPRPISGGGKLHARGGRKVKLCRDFTPLLEFSFLGYI